MSLYPMQLFYTAIQEEKYFHAGFLRKPNGAQGGIVAVWLYPLGGDKVSKLPALFVEINHVKVPYVVQCMTPLTEMKAIIAFKGVLSKPEAYLLRNLSLFLPLPLQSKSMSSAMLCEIVGYVAIDPVLGQLGKVDAMYCMRNKYVLSVDYKGKELLIPYEAPFLSGVDKQQQRVAVVLPEGYLAAMV